MVAIGIDLEQHIVVLEYGRMAVHYSDQDYEQHYHMLHLR